MTMPPDMALTPRDWIEIDRELGSRSLIDFVRMAWHVVEPAAPYVHGWHADAVAEHLQAVTSGQITRLLINVPPGMSKSLLCNVFFPAFEWGPKNKQAMRYVATAHSQNLAVRDNVKCRRLVQSRWFQERWPVQLTGDQNEKRKFENTRTGFREAMAFTGMTGSRGDRVLIDDPMSVDDALSETVRDNINTTFAEALPTRLNSPERSAIVVIMQRLHQNDVAGLILEKDLGYEHLCLPMEFESNHPHISRTSLGFVDPRKNDGDLLFPARFPKHVIERDKKVMASKHGSTAVAGQFQQRPAAREGEMFKRAWFNIVDASPARARRVRAWDLASTEKEKGKEPDWMAGVRMSEADGRYYIEHVARWQKSPHESEQAMKATASQDGPLVPIDFPQDPGAAGKSYAAVLIRMLSGYSVKASPESGSKEVRATGFAAQCEAGNVFLVRGEWNDAFIDELCNFPLGKNDDQVDAASRAFNRLVNGSAYNLENAL